MNLKNQHYCLDLATTRQGIALRRALDVFLNSPDLETKEGLYEAIGNFYTFHGKQLNEDLW